MPTSRSTTERPVIGALDARAVSRLLQASSDITLVLDEAGIILDVVLKPDDARAGRLAAWRGQPWLETVTAESRQKVQALLRDVQADAASGSARARQVNHPVDNSDDLPVIYSAMRLAPESPANSSGMRILAFGRDLSATMALQRRLVDTQQAMERDYWRFREAETRYRHLLDSSSEAVLIVEGATQKVREANPAAKALCGDVRGKLLGSSLTSLFASSDGERLHDLLAAARSVGTRESMPARLAEGTDNPGLEVGVSASVFRQEETAFVLVRLTRTLRPATLQEASDAASARGRRDGKPGNGGRASAAAAGSAMTEGMLAAFVQSLPDGLVFCSADGQVLLANRAFLTLAELSAEEQARGQPLDRWLGRTGVEFGVLQSNLRQRGSVSRFATVLRGEYGAQMEVEISAAQIGAGGDTILAFAIRDTERRARPEAEVAAPAVTRSVSELTELVGRTPLKDIVSETTDLIEQLCIETALQMSNDNRASAALLLGLSRQSLYVKLRRYGLGSLGSDE